jgi:hypothetical protein
MGKDFITKLLCPTHLENVGTDATLCKYVFFLNAT